ncbi:LysE/ArgO family amino acid transporter [Veronia pacifica]|uniref:Amino acid transporter n=1 Tax=Veronia pacifica TaxID=1080227 RepID=A0A1C3EDU2_9GAMM|nr:LysE/ArgO family amino acid transporter [Veronia pacifica]ODA31380.1 amino acid transporter [Veronia pacifica]
MSFLTIAQGFGLGLSMIIPIGAQNAFVLNQGLNRRYHLLTAAICSVCDIVLIVTGVFGGGLLLANSPLLLNIVTVGGIAFVTLYAWQSFRSAFSEPEEMSLSVKGFHSLTAVILGTLAVTLLNPHVYLDTVVVLGSMGGQLVPDERVAFAVGAVIASLVWFFSLAIAAARLAPRLNQPRVRKGIDIFVGLMMLFVAVKLALFWLEA